MQDKQYLIWYQSDWGSIILMVDMTDAMSERLSDQTAFSLHYTPSWSYAAKIVTVVTSGPTKPLENHCQDIAPIVTITGCQGNRRNHKGNIQSTKDKQTLTHGPAANPFIWLVYHSKYPLYRNLHLRYYMLQFNVPGSVDQLFRQKNDRHNTVQHFCNYMV